MRSNKSIERGIPRTAEGRIIWKCPRCNHSWLLEPHVLPEPIPEVLTAWERIYKRKWEHCNCGIEFPKDRQNI